MATNQEHAPAAQHSSVERAEEMLDRLGKRFQDVRANVGRAIEQRGQRQGNGAQRPATTQEALGSWGERVGFVAGLAGRRVLQWGTRAREEAEDLWAEAQSMRQRSEATGSASEPVRQHGKAEVEHTADEPHHEHATEGEERDAGATPS